MDKFTVILFQIFGLGSFTRNSKLSKLSLAYTTILVMLNVLGAIVVLLYGNLTVNCAQNAMTRFGFWIQFYGRLYLATYMLVTTIQNKDLIQDVHVILKLIDQHTAVCRKHLRISQITMTVCNVILFLSAAILLIVDCVIFPSNANFFIIWTAFAPGLTIILYVTYITKLIYHASILFRSLNVYLKGFCTELTLDSVHSFTKDLGMFNVSRLHDFFMKYDTVFEMCVKLNRIYGNCMVLFMLLSLHGTITFLYVEQLELSSIRNRMGLFYREHHFSEYWAMLYVFSVFTLVFIVHKLNVQASRTKTILHQLRSSYKNIGDHTFVYSFQLEFSRVNTQAAGFFDLDYSALVAMIGLSVKYLFIVMQFDRVTLKEEY